MAQIIKTLGQLAHEGAKEMYGDVIVEKGTLLVLDFSNKGTLDGFKVNNGAIVRDIAKGSSLGEYGVNNQGHVNATAGDAFLTPGKGFSVFGIPLGTPDQGVVISDLLDNVIKYLNDNQPHCSITLWMRSSSENVGGFPIRVKSGGNYNSTDIRLNIATSTRAITGTFAGGNSQNIAAVTVPTNQAIQYTMEFTGSGQPVKIYVDGTFYGNANNATGFSAGTGSLIFGKPEGNTPASDTVIYRVIIEDLDETGRSALELAQKDWDYCNALGEFEGIPKRPFVDTY